MSHARDSVMLSWLSRVVQWIPAARTSRRQFHPGVVMEPFTPLQFMSIECRSAQT